MFTFGLMGSDTRPVNTADDIKALIKARADARNMRGSFAPSSPMGRIEAAHQPFNAPPNARVAQGFQDAAQPQPTGMPGLGLNPGAPATPMNWLQGGQYKPSPPPAPQPQAPIPPVMAQGPTQSTPMPAPRPPEAPSALQSPEPMGFFARNTAMMSDPAGGGFIDPGAAAQAQATGPDLISKMIAYLHGKAGNTA